MLSFKTFLSEMKFEDMYGAGFKDFHNKYKKSSVKSDTNIFVNFSAYQNNTIDKNPYNNPDHTDPVGVYGYPLKYVIDFPSDVRYGKSAPYLRVLKMTSKARPWYIQNMSHQDCKLAFREIHPKEDYDFLLKCFSKMLDSKHEPALWFQMIQNTEESFELISKYYGTPKNKKDYSLSAPTPILKSGKEQTEMFLNLGYNVIIDNATKQNKAAVNDREPEQVIFLRRDAFEIVEVFHLKGKSENTFMVSVSSEDEAKFARKMAAIICSGIGDSLTNEKPQTSNLGGYKLFFTKKGRQIYTGVENQQDYTNLKFGEKPHRQYKKHNEEVFKVKIVSEKKTLERKSFTDESLDDFLKATIEYWNEKTELNDSFTPIFSGEEWKQEVQKQRRQEADLKIKKEVTRLKLESQKINDVCDILKQPHFQIKNQGVLNLTERLPNAGFIHMDSLDDLTNFDSNFDRMLEVYKKSVINSDYDLDFDWGKLKDFCHTVFSNLKDIGYSMEDLQNSLRKYNSMNNISALNSFWYPVLKLLEKKNENK